MPPLELCTDNAAMIAAAGHFGAPSPGATVDPSLGWGAMTVKGWEVVFRASACRRTWWPRSSQANGITVEVFGDTAYSVAVNFTEARVLVPEDSAEQARELIKQAER